MKLTKQNNTLNYFKVLFIAITIALLVVACDNKNEKQQEPIDNFDKGKVKRGDENSLPNAEQFENKEFLLGVWLRTNDKGSGYEGFEFKDDYTLKLENIYYEIGDKWELDKDTITVWTHTEKYPDSEPTKYVIGDINDSIMILSKIIDSNTVKKDIYRKKR